MGERPGEGGYRRTRFDACRNLAGLSLRRRLEG
jgi:hypothetical protein